MTDWILTSLELETLLGEPRSMIQCEDAALAQARHITQKMEERCTDHPVLTGICDPSQFLGKRFLAHRYLCPVCRKELEEAVK